MEKAVTESNSGMSVLSPALLVAAILLIGISIAAVLRLYRRQFTGEPLTQTVAIVPSRTVANFGRFGPQVRPTLDFTVTNQSDHTMKIEHVIPSCSCIAATCFPREVAAGATATVAVTYRGFPGVFGPFGKSVAVTYRELPAGSQTVFRLFVHGDAVSDVPFQVYPQNVYLGNIIPGSSITSHLYFHGRMCLLQSLPAVVRLFPGHQCQLILRQIGDSRATRDKVVQLIIQVPVTQPAGKFRCPVSFTGSALGRVRVRVEGHILTRKPAAAGNSRHEPSKAMESAPGEPAK